MPRKNASKGARNYVFTVNNPDSQLEPELWPQDKLRYVIWALEFGSLNDENDGGQLHYQGYLELKTQLNMGQIHRWAGLERAALAQRRGSQQQAIAYVKKQDETFLEGPWEYGTRAAQGTREDLRLLQHDLDNGHSISYVAKNHFSNFIRYHRGIKEYLKVSQPKIEDKKYKISDFNRDSIDLSKSVVLLGDTKLGKTEFALAHFDFPLFVRHIDALKDLIIGEHDGIVFDDMTFGHLHAGARIALLDMEHTSQIHCRHDIATIPRHFRRIFTTNNPDIFFSPRDTDSERSAVNRRFNLVHIDRPLFGLLPDPVQPSLDSRSVMDRIRDDTSLLDLYRSYGTITPSPDYSDYGYNISDLYADE